LFHPLEQGNDGQARAQIGFTGDLGSIETLVVQQPYVVNVYIGSSDSHLFLGEASVQDIAFQIAGSRGPSGPNSEYVFQLSHFMKTEIPDASDPHLFAIEQALLEIMSNS
jgi:cation transport protein ChaC